MELVRSSLSIVSGLPCETVRSAPAIVVSGPAQRLLTLRPARSPSRHATLYTEGSDSFVASAAASIATGWSEPVPGRELHPLKSSAFSRRTISPTVLSARWTECERFLEKPVSQACSRRLATGNGRIRSSIRVTPRLHSSYERGCQAKTLLHCSP
jgi:hypothetical protein